MDQVTNVSVSKLESSRYIKPLRIHYSQNNQRKAWDLGLSSPSVAVVIYNKSRNTLVLVKQLRPAVLFAEVMKDFNAAPKCDDTDDTEKINQLLTDLPGDIGKRGITTELCAGIVDKNKSLAEIATEEVFEECGYQLSKPIEFVQTFRASIGTGGSQMSLFYAEVSDQDKVSSGGGLAAEGEMIEVVELGLEEVREWIRSPNLNSPTFTLYGLMWFMANKAS